MPLRSKRHALVAPVVVLLIGVAVRTAAQTAPAVPAERPDAIQIARAIDIVKADPNLATERTIKTLRWRSSSPSKPPRMPGWLSWLTGLFGWAGESARVLVWVAALGLVAMLAIYLTRIARTRLGAERADSFVVPTHVRDLDIRPETLPHDIGAAARALWDRGEQRPALALLYRGMLSRLAHVHGIPIRDSSTEGDCLALATPRLPAERTEYLDRLVRVWQRFRYGRQQTDTAAVHRLCDEFAAALQPKSTRTIAVQREMS